MERETLRRNSGWRCAYLARRDAEALGEVLPEAGEGTVATPQGHRLQRQVAGLQQGQGMAEPGFPQHFAQTAPFRRQAPAQGGGAHVERSLKVRRRPLPIRLGSHQQADARGESRFLLAGADLWRLVALGVDSCSEGGEGCGGGVVHRIDTQKPKLGFVGQ